MSTPLTAGMAGIDNTPVPENAFDADRDLHEIFATLRAALTTADESAMQRDAFGDAVIDHYMHAARWEQTALHSRVTDCERQRGFYRS